PSRFSYSWMRNAQQLRRLVLPEHLRQAAAPVVIDRFVFVEVDVDEAQQLDEAAWVSELAAREPGIAGMVGSLPLERGPAIEPDLSQLCKHKTLRAVRRLIQNQSDPDFCIR